MVNFRWGVYSLPRALMTQPGVSSSVSTMGRTRRMTPSWVCTVMGPATQTPWAMRCLPLSETGLIRSAISRSSYFTSTIWRAYSP